MQIEISTFLEDSEIFRNVPRAQETIVLESLLYWCCKESREKFICSIINDLDDYRLIEELESRGYTITKNE